MRVLRRYDSDHETCCDRHCGTDTDLSVVGLHSRHRALLRNLRERAYAGSSAGTDAPTLSRAAAGRTAALVMIRPRNAPIRIDRRRLPLVQLTFPSAWSTPEFSRALNEFAALVIDYTAKGQRIALLADCSNAGLPTSRERQMIAVTVHEHGPALKKICAGWAVVVTTAFGRGVITAINWISPPPIPIGVFATVEEAEAWCWARLRLKS